MNKILFLVTFLVTSSVIASTEQEKKMDSPKECVIIPGTTVIDHVNYTIIIGGEKKTDPSIPFVEAVKLYRDLQQFGVCKQGRVNYKLATSL